MRDNEYVQHPSRPLVPAWAVLNSQHLIVLASNDNDPEGPEKYNNTEVKYAPYSVWSSLYMYIRDKKLPQLFTAAKQHLTPAVVKYKNLEKKWSLGSINHNKLQEIADSVWLSLYIRDNEYVQHLSLPLAS
jgi:hypothetical protein